MVDHRDATVDFIRLRGPSLPAQLAKHLSSNTLLASAVMSELVDKGKLKISKLKVGGSPLYFVPGQEEQLLKFLESLDEKDRRTVWLLQQKRVLRDSEQDPLVRVSLRQIKDFAVQLTVTIGDQSEMFWKYFAVADGDVHGLIETMLAPKKKVVESALVQEGQQQKLAGAPASSAKARAPRKRKAVEKPLTSITPVSPVTVPVSTGVVSSQAPIGVASSKVTVNVPLVPAAHPQVLPQAAPRSASVKTAGADAFFDVLLSYFAQNKIELVEHEIVRKNIEHDCVVKVPSPVGSLMYYCKAKRKLKVGELDVSAAFAQGQLRKLPVLLLAPGEVTPKGLELAQRLKCVTFARVQG